MIRDERNGSLLTQAESAIVSHSGRHSRRLAVPVGVADADGHLQNGVEVAAIMRSSHLRNRERIVSIRELEKWPLLVLQMLQSRKPTGLLWP